MTTHGNTILAVSSPPGRGPRAILRISSNGLEKQIPLFFDAAPPPHRLATCRLRGQDLPVLCLYFPGPRSYTGQDVLELQLPGHPALVDRVLHQLLETLRATDPDARLAEGGEFTQRAFLAGRIDLTRAEGIAATIGAVSDAQLAAAKLLRTGRLGRWAESCVDRLAHLLALVEAGIDFVDQEDVVAIQPEILDAGLSELERDVEGMLTRSRSWSALEALPWVVLVGRPNAGKSTLFNALLSRERAVTSDIPGTTRDVLAEPMRIATAQGDAEIMLADVAGLDDTPSGMNRAMQWAAHDAIGRADLLVLLHNPLDSVPPLEPLRPDVPVIHVHTKSDLTTTPGAELAISAVTGKGLDELRRRITEELRNRAVTLSGEMLALTPRHHDELHAAINALRHARKHTAPELAADAMRQALNHLGALGGQITADDVIGRIFAEFCIGK